MRLNLLKYPLVLKKNESIRGQEKGQYKNNGLLFPPQDLAPSGPTNLSPNRPSIYLQSIYCLLNQLLPPAPMSFLQYQSLACCSFKALSQEIFPLLALASVYYANDLMLFNLVAQALIVLIPLVYE